MKQTPTTLTVNIHLPLDMISFFDELSSEQGIKRNKLIISVLEDYKRKIEDEED